MLLRIESISNAAVWSGYDARSSTPQEFARYNLIYGWNASGKTTLSRVFGLLNTAAGGKLPHGARARFKFEQEVLDSGREQDRGRIAVCIFNRDFIDANLQQTDYTQAPALFIVGEDNIRLSNRIASLAQRREKVASIYRTAKKKHDDSVVGREKAATGLARECATMLGVRDFRAPNLKALVQRLVSPPESLLDDDALQVAVAHARDQSEFFAIRSLPVVVPQDLLGDDILILLRETPKQSTLQRLADDPSLSDWVRSGLRFHEHGANCAFCGGDASQALEAYAKHFSDEYRRQHASITAAIARLEKHRALPSYPHEREWVPDARSKFLDAINQLEAWDAHESQIRAAWLKQLRAKLANMETVFAAAAVKEPSVSLGSALEKLSQARDEHNHACEELTNRRRAAADKVKWHFAARYLLDPGAAETIETLSSASGELERVKGVGLKIVAQAKEANTELQRSSVAASEINDLLKRLLGPRISVEQAQDGRLQFVREGQPAINMSDGERTAISLAYFLVSMGQNGQQLENVVVFVDDPICSLDANHIYDVAYLLMTRLKRCRQLFISTHNAEFFNTVKQEWTDRGRFKSGHAGFLVHREIERGSKLSALPAHLTKFRSDYHHVFYCLRQIQASASQDVDAYLHCPNLLRRFLEMYLGFRKPSASGYQAKLDVLLDDEVMRGAVARFVDEGSHSASTLRLLEFADFPTMSRGMVERVLAALEAKDPSHYEALIIATS